jgi:hypothetical protein
MSHIATARIRRINKAPTARSYDVFEKVLLLRKRELNARIADLLAEGRG